MNDLDLPPRRTLPPEVRDRIRTAVHVSAPRPRYRAPLSVAAAVAVLVAGAVVVGQSTSGRSDGHRPAAPPASSSTAPPASPGSTVPRSDSALTVAEPDARSNKDLDHCWEAVETSGRTADYAPRATWQPVFTATRARPYGGGGVHDGAMVRVTAFRDPSGKPGFCVAVEVLGDEAREDRPWQATVSDPTAEPIPLATGISGVFFNGGMLAGVAEGVDSMEFTTTYARPDAGVVDRLQVPPVLHGGLFVGEVAGMFVPEAVAVTGRDSNGNEVTRGEWVYDPAKDPLAGPTSEPYD